MQFRIVSRSSGKTLGTFEAKSGMHAIAAYLRSLGHEASVRGADSLETDAPDKDMLVGAEPIEAKG